VEDGTAAEVGLEHAAIAVRGEEDVHREGGSEEGNFRGGLEGEEEAVRMRIRCRRRRTAPQVSSALQAIDLDAMEKLRKVTTVHGDDGEKVVRDGEVLKAIDLRWCVPFF
jgi:hypothetical protein